MTHVCGIGVQRFSLLQRDISKSSYFVLMNLCIVEEQRQGFCVKLTNMPDGYYRQRHYEHNAHLPDRERDFVCLEIVYKFYDSNDPNFVEKQHFEVSHSLHRRKVPGVILGNVDIGC